MKRPSSAAPKGANTNKRRRPNPTAKGKEQKKSKATGPKNAFERAYIPIPTAEDSASDLEEGDIEYFASQNGTGAFLHSLDQKGIARSKKETDRLHQFYKPVRAQKQDDDLPSVNSHSDDDSDWSGVENADGVDNDEDLELSDTSSIASSPHSLPDSDTEMPYERVPRRKHESSQPRDTKEVPRLPIKMSDGRVQLTGSRTVAKDVSEDEEESQQDEIDAWQMYDAPKVEDVTTGARFGRPAVVDVLRIRSRKHRVQSAKEQIASLSQEVIADPENNLALLRRLETFSRAKVTSPAHPDPVANDPIIRKLAFLSQMTVFKDVAPGYRIRQLTDKEKSEKVSQMVQRTRDFEQGLVAVYQSYLRSLHTELKAKSELAPVALQCFCTLLTDLTHFNFRANIMGAVVGHLSRKSWDESSDLCQRAVIAVFRSDETGDASLELVRLLNRMVKERHFHVHGNVLAPLMHLRLKNELHVRASDTKADKDSDGARPSMKRGKNKKGKDGEPQHVSKKQKKALKEKKEIEKEMREADAEVDKEERAKIHTETLKLLFALYFRVLKNPKRTPLLTTALRGISRFAHLVNIDFFRDLLKVLQEHAATNLETDLEEGDDNVDPVRAQHVQQQDLQYQLQCIVTAFELLSGQGEAITIDLEDFVTYLYKMIPTLATCPTLEAPVDSAVKRNASGEALPKVSLSSMLLRALSLALLPRRLQQVGTAHTTPTRTASFIKRLLSACLSMPPRTSQQLLVFVRTLVATDVRLEALFTSDERSHNGRYRADLDDPQLANPWSTSAYEVIALCERHWDANVREEAARLANFVRD
ncbi:nucleolar complex-associated protein 3 [Auriculariales sp. MPI-PUGE-AT-0066]|nr:nucleolar complex-associated protein 3 [Auriculariales sp. MPI-PUGE-AT-0066]